MSLQSHLSEKIKISKKKRLYRLRSPDDGKVLDNVPYGGFSNCFKISLLKFKEQIYSPLQHERHLLS